MVLAEMEGADAASATVSYARERGRRRGRERWGQLQRIAEVHGLGEPDAFDDVRLRVLHEVVAYVDEHVWRDALDDVRRHVLEDEEGDGWFPELAERRRRQMPLEPPPDLDDRPADHLVPREDALFQPLRHAISDMTMKQEDAVAQARAHLAAEQSGMTVDENYVCPNPYLDLWIVGYSDPQRPREPIDGGGPIIVLPDGQTYELGGGPGHPREFLGAILPPEDEWE
jgi:hypothetical protein